MTDSEWMDSLTRPSKTASAALTLLGSWIVFLTVVNISIGAYSEGRKVLWIDFFTGVRDSSTTDMAFVIDDGMFGLIGIIIINYPNRLDRLVSFWSEDLWRDDAKIYQTQQALIGIARGDWFGTGLGAGIQKYYLLPERHTDMIFAVIGEELGVLGMLFVLFSFLFILLKGFSISKVALQKGRLFSSYVVFGICTWFAMQITVNIGMNLGLLPPKGFTLPLLSYGGTSMIFSIIAPTSPSLSFSGRYAFKISAS